MGTDDMIADARTRLIESIASARGAAADSDGAIAHYAIEALTSVMPQLPAVVEDQLDKAMGSADARIYTRAELRKLVAESAIDILLTQASAIERWMRVRKRGGTRVSAHRR